MKLFLALLLVSGSAFARGGGYSAGDGGHGVQCGSVVELLDLYEARRLYGFAPDLGNSSMTNWPYYFLTMETARFRFKEAIPLTPHMKKLFGRAEELAQTAERVDWVYGAPRTDDVGPLLVPLHHGCKISQVANHATLRGVNDSRIRINQDLWDGMSEVDQAATFLHESFHDYFHGKTTLAIRQFVMYLTAPREFRERNRRVFARLVTTRGAVPPKDFR